MPGHHFVTFAPLEPPRQPEEGGGAAVAEEAEYQYEWMEALARGDAAPRGAPPSPPAPLSGTNPSVQSGGAPRLC